MNSEPRPSPDCSMDKIDDYIEKLYEDVNEKITGAKCILSLARQAENLPGLLQNGGCQ